MSYQVFKVLPYRRQASARAAACRVRIRTRLRRMGIKPPPVCDGTRALIKAAIDSLNHQH